MHRRPILASIGLILLVPLALIEAAGCQSHASAGRQTNSGDAPQKVVTVVIRKFKFEPAAVTVQIGDTVEWKNEDIVPHTATADDEAQDPAFDSRTIQTGKAWRYIARKKGTYTYSCTLHPNMSGRLIVQ